MPISSAANSLYLEWVGQLFSWASSELQSEMHADWQVSPCLLSSLTKRENCCPRQSLTIRQGQLGHSRQRWWQSLKNLVIGSWNQLIETNKNCCCDFHDGYFLPHWRLLGSKCRHSSWCRRMRCCCRHLLHTDHSSILPGSFASKVTQFHSADFAF